jgi:uroporphyrinogen III methyltransferase/synthase
MGEFDWAVVTSPSAVRCLFDMLPQSHLDLRRMPRIMSCGPGTSREFRARSIHPDAEPESNFGGEGLMQIAGGAMQPGMRVLRLRSDKAGPVLADALAEQGMDVTDCVLYDNVRVACDARPEFDAIYFASSSAVESFVEQWGVEAARDAVTCAIGQPTRKTMQRAGVHVSTMGVEATTEGAIQALAGYYVNRDMEDMA